MPSEPTSTTSIAWREVFPWLLLTRTPALAMRGRVMLLAAVGMLAVTGGDWLLSSGLSEPAASAPQPTMATENIAFELAASGWRRVSAAWWEVIEPFVTFCSSDLGAERTASESLWEARVFTGMRCLWRVLVWGLLGGAILRIAAMSLTRDETVPLPAALQSVAENKAGFFGGPLLLLAGMALLAMPLGIARLAMQVSVMESVGALLWPVVLIASVVVALFGIGAIVGWPLVIASAATEKSDSFDTLSRMFAYVYQKPLRLVGYVAVAALLAGVAGLAAEWLLQAVLMASHVALPTNLSPWAAEKIATWETVFGWLIQVFFTGYLWTSAEAIYLLRRHDIDGVHLDEVHQEEAV